MNQATRIVVKDVLVFGLALAAVNLLTEVLVKFVTEDKGPGVFMQWHFYRFELMQAVTASAITLCATRLLQKRPSINFRKLVVASIGILVVDYHLCYIYDLIVYYSESHPVVQKKEGLEALLNLFETNEHSPPVYTFHEQFVWIFIHFCDQLHVGIAAVLNPLVTNPLILSLWINALVVLFLRKRAKALPDN